MGFATYTSTELEDLRVNSMCRAFDRMDTVLVGRWVTTKVEDDGPAPAWSDGKTITFNKKKLYGKVTDVDSLIRLHGLNYHELGHVLYTPRFDHDLVQWCIKENMFWAFNMLEDQRQERLLTNEYSSTIPYFVSIIMRYIVEESPDLTRTFPLTHGRRYLPANVRDALEAKYVDQQNVKRIAAIIDEFRMIPFFNSAHTSRAKALIREFARLVSEAKSEDIDPYAHQKRGTGEGSMQKHGQQQRATDDAEKSEGEEGEGTGDGDGEDGEGEGSGSGKADKPGDQQGDGAGDGEGEGEGQDGEEGNDKGNAGSGKTKGEAKGQQPGSGVSGSGSELNDRELQEAMKKAITKAESSQQVQKDIAEVQKTVKDHTAKNAGDRPSLDVTARNGSRTPDPLHAVAAKKFSREIARLELDLDPGFRTHQSNGRLNMKRSLEHVDYDTAFDQWEAGINDATELEVVILVDQSSSMSSIIDGVCEALWVIKRGVESASKSTSVTVIGFNVTARVLAPATEKASATAVPYYYSGGGTNPKAALREARRIFAATRKTRGALFILTDGVWDENYASEEQIKLMGQAGVITSVVYLKNEFNRYTDEEARQAFQHEAQLFHAINDMSDLVPLAKQVVKTAMRKGITK